MNLDTFSWRFRVLQSKATGKLPALPWSHLSSMMAQPFEKWDYQYFATRLDDRSVPGMVQFETAVGRFYGRPEDQDSIGGVIVEEICRVYERPPVSVRPGDIVVDLGGHVGTFTRVALNARAKLVVAFEANAVNANCFRATFRDEIAHGKVVLIESPVWSEPCTVHFSGQGLVGQIADEGDAKEAVTIDDVVRKLDLPRWTSSRQISKGPSGKLSLVPRTSCRPMHPGWRSPVTIIRMTRRCFGKLCRDITRMR